MAWAMEKKRGKSKQKRQCFKSQDIKGLCSPVVSWFSPNMEKTPQNYKESFGGKENPEVKAVLTTEFKHEFSHWVYTLFSAYIPPLSQHKYKR